MMRFVLRHHLTPTLATEVVFQRTGDDTGLAARTLCRVEEKTRLDGQDALPFTFSTSTRLS
jgi:hypothetical protein